MISFNSKIVNIGALFLAAYLYYQYNNEMRKVNNNQSYHFQSTQYDSRSAMHKFSIQNNKKYKDFSICEKFVYNLYKDNIPHDIRIKIEN